MSHCLHGYIIKKDTLDMSKIPHIEHEGFVIIPMSDQFFSMLGNPAMLKPALVEKLKTFVEVQTDYFGGFGEQEAWLFVNGIEEFVTDPDHPINWALNKLGVVRTEDMDEFDTISLGSYRSASDIVDEWTDKFKIENPKEKSGLEIERRFLLKSMPSIMQDRIFNGYRGVKIGQVYSELPNGEKIRYRRVYDVSGKSYTYFETKKTYISPGVNQEDEKEISETEYVEGTKFGKRAITKTRYLFLDENSGLTWEIDDFGSMIIAEVEIPHIDHFINMPQCITEKSVMEVTGIKAFDNYSLAVPM